MVSGATEIERDYFDPITGNDISITMSIRDHIYFRLLQQLINANKGAR